MRQRYAVPAVVVLLLYAFAEMVTLQVWPPSVELKKTTVGFAFAALAIVTIVAILAKWQRVVAAAAVVFAVRTASHFHFHPTLGVLGPVDEDGVGTLVKLTGGFEYFSDGPEPFAVLFLGFLLWGAYGPMLVDAFRRFRERLRTLKQERPATATVVVLLLLDAVTGTGLERLAEENSWMNLALYLTCGAIALLLAEGVLRHAYAPLVAAAFYFIIAIVVELAMSYAGGEAWRIPLLAGWGLIRCNNAFAERDLPPLPPRPWYASES